MFGSNDRSPASAMVTRIVEQVVPAVVDSIDVDALLARIDVDALLERIDVDALIRRIDLDGLMTRIDVDSIVGRIDLDALMERIDVAGIAQRAEIGELVAQSTSQVGGSVLDLGRRPLVGLDVMVVRVVNRLLRRDLSQMPAGPARLVGTEAPAEEAS